MDSTYRAHFDNSELNEAECLAQKIMIDHYDGEDARTLAAFVILALPRLRKQLAA